jgi:phosphatidylglycerophosphatase A
MECAGNPVSVGEKLAVFVATGFYLSYIPVKLLKFLPGSDEIARANPHWTGAGFVGTLLGLVWIPLFPRDPWRYAIMVFVLMLGAFWASHVAERALGQKDDSRIIVDEMIGYWTTIAFLPKNCFYCLSGFVLFRILDSIKLPPYRWLERLPGGYGIVMDDVGAGVFANLILQAVRCSGWA